MSNDTTRKTGPGQSNVYQIMIDCHLGNEWEDWFGDMTITQDESVHTILTGPVADQAALFGLLKKIRDLGLPLISIDQGNYSGSEKNEGNSHEQ